MPQISVIVPIYSTEKYIHKCINSILGQSFRDIEIILVNDGSEDNCGQIVNEYQKADARIKVIHKENGGLWSARNAGLDIATGKYISFIDSDDWVKREMLEEMYNKAEEHQADLVVCNYNKVYADRTEENVLKVKEELIKLDQIGFQDYFYNYWFQNNHGREVCNKLYKREIIKQKKILFEKNKEIFAEDLLFNFYYLCHIKKIYAVNSSYYNYLQHNSSIMAGQKPDLAVKYTELVQRFSNYTRNMGVYKDLRKILPVVFYNRISIGLFAEYSIANDLSAMVKVLTEASKIPVFKTCVKELAFGNAASIFRKKTGGTKEAEMRCRVFASYCYFKLFRLAAKQKYKRYINT